MFSLHFLHELRTAAYETRRVAAIPALLTLVTFLLWSGDCAGEGTLARLAAANSGYLIKDFLNGSWVYVGWLVPWAMLRRPSLPDAAADWRTGPVPASTVFGARLLWAALATVVLPAVIAGGTCVAVKPVVALDQVAALLWIQFTLITLGAFAAFVGKGLRGLWLVGGLTILWFIANLAGEEGAHWVLHHLILKDADSERGCAARHEYLNLGNFWPGIVPWVLIPATLSLWTVIKIRRPASPSRLWPWVLGCGLVPLLAQFAWLLSPYLRPAYPDEPLPSLRLSLDAQATKPGKMRINGKCLGVTEVTLPEPDLQILRLSRGADSPFYYESEMAADFDYSVLSGNWVCGSKHGPLAPHLKHARLGLSVMSLDGELGQMPVRNNSQGYGLPHRLRPLATTLGLPEVKVWTATGAMNWCGESKPCTPTYEWVDAANFLSRPQRVNFTLGIPYDYDTPTPQGGRTPLVLDPKALAGQTLTGHARMRVMRLLPPKLIGRVPALAGGTIYTEDGERLTIPALEPGDWRFPAKRRWSFGPVQLRPRLSRNVRLLPPHRYTLALLNVGEKQVILLPGDGSDLSASLPTHAPALTPAWYAGAEFVVLEYTETPVTLPLEFSLTLPPAQPVPTR